MRIASNRTSIDPEAETRAERDRRIPGSSAGEPMAEADAQIAHLLHGGFRRKRKPGMELGRICNRCTAEICCTEGQEIEIRGAWRADGGQGRLSRGGMCGSKIILFLP